MWSVYAFPSQEAMEEYFWEGVSTEFVDWYYEFQSDDGALNEIYSTSVTANNYLAVPGVFLQIFHVIVLTRKSMRTSSTNVFLIAIAFSDLVYILIEVYRHWESGQVTYFASWWSGSNDPCALPRSYLRWMLQLLAVSLRDYLIHCSVFFGLLLTIVRCLAIRSKSVTLSNTLISTRFAVKIIPVVLLISLPMPILDWFSHKLVIFKYDVTSSECPERIWSPSYQFEQFGKESKENRYAFVIAIVDTIVFQLIPSIFSIIFTILLVIELQKARRRGLSLGNEAVQTTKINILVLLLAIQFVITRVLLTFTTFLRSQLNVIDALATFINGLPSMITFVMVINSFLHFVICVSLSSQYRNAVRNMFVMERAVELTEETRNEETEWSGYQTSCRFHEERLDCIDVRKVVDNVYFIILLTE